MIRVYAVNFRDTWDIRIDRKTKYGNPFYMADESQRDVVCDRYEEYIATRPDLINELVREVLAVPCHKDNREVRLGCWCAPKRCHGDTLARLVMERINK